MFVYVVVVDGDVVMCDECLLKIVGGIELGGVVI